MIFIVVMNINENRKRSMTRRLHVELSGNVVKYKEIFQLIHHAHILKRISVI